LQERFYPSVATFSADLAHVFTTEIGVQPAGDTAELQMQISGRAPELSLEQREKRKLAKRIIKAIQPSLEDAIRKESELNRKPFEQELKELDLMLENSVMSRRGSEVDAPEQANDEQALTVPNGTEQKVEEMAVLAKSEPEDTAGVADVPGKTDAPVEPSAVESQPAEASTEPQVQQDTNMEDAPADMQDTEPPSADVAPTVVQPTIEDQPPVPDQNGNMEKESVEPSKPPVETQKGPLTPPPSFKGDQQYPLAQGGIQWYMQPFDPIGTTIHEERWTGRDVMRGMSEELSELDEEELKDLVEDEELEGQMINGSNEAANGGDAPTQQNVKVHRTRRRWRGFR